MSKKSNKTVTPARVPKRVPRPSLEMACPPVSFGVVSRATKPKVNGTEKFVVKRREFVGTTTNGAVTGFAVTPLSAANPGYDLNPSCAPLFPWLAQLANCFERFRFNKVQFDFIPGQSTSTAGRFYAAVDYDYDDAVATSKPVLMGNMTSVESAVWQPCRLVLDPKSLNRDLPYRYISCTTRGLAVEGRTSYAGYLMCAFDTTVANCLIDIWVEYEVELVTPVNDGVMVQELDYPAATMNAVANLTAAVGASFAGALIPSRSTLSSGPLSLVQGGSFGVPIFNKTIGGAVFACPFGVDIREVKNKQALTCATRFNSTGDAPNAVLGAGQADVLWSAYDYQGVYLGEINPTTVAATKSSIGPVTGGGGTVGGYVFHVMSILLERLFPVYPTARYLVPVLAAAAAYGGGSNSFGFTCAL